MRGRQSAVVRLSTINRKSDRLPLKSEQFEENTMWILFARAPMPDKPYWTGRRVLAAFDALLWPALAVLLLAKVPGAPGVLKPVLGAVALLAALHRLHVAWFRNHRYRFTTWWLVRVLVVLLLVGVVLKITLAA